MQLARDIAAGLWESIRETLPSDEREGGVFLAGMTWAFLIFFSFLVFFTWLALKMGRAG